MKRCFICGHTTIIPDITNKMIEENGHFIIVKDIPCLKCENCGEIYLETKVMLKLEQIMSRDAGEIEIIDFRHVA